MVLSIRGSVGAMKKTSGIIKEGRVLIPHEDIDAKHAEIGVLPDPGTRPKASFSLA
jgi:hypothetical protein